MLKSSLIGYIYAYEIAPLQLPIKDSPPPLSIAPSSSNTTIGSICREHEVAEVNGDKLAVADSSNSGDKVTVNNNNDKSKSKLTKLIKPKMHFRSRSKEKNIPQSIPQTVPQNVPQNVVEVKTCVETELTTHWFFTCTYHNITNSLVEWLEDYEWNSVIGKF